MRELFFSRSSRRLLGGFCALLLTPVVFAGCSKNERDAGTVPVTGKVTYNGQPLEGATVTLLNDGTLTPGAGMSQADGTYTLRVKPGAYTVTVSKLSGGTDNKAVSMEEAMANANEPPEAPKETLPAKYHSVEESPFKFEAKASGENKCDLSLSDE